MPSAWLTACRLFWLTLAIAVLALSASGTAEAQSWREMIFGGEEKTAEEQASPKPDPEPAPTVDKNRTAQKRLALVIGNAAYDNMSSLANPVRDARAMAGVLRGYGIEVVQGYDLTIGEFHTLVSRFRQKARTADVVFVYYAGHGLQSEGRDVLAPVDVTYQCPEGRSTATIYGGIRLRDLLAGLGAETAMQVVMIDACRNQPFKRCPKSRSAGEVLSFSFRALGRLGGTSRSLMLANATQPGGLSADGPPGRHSPFNSALRRAFEQYPKSPLRDVLDRASAQVKRATEGVQVPQVTTNGGAPLLCLAVEGCGEGVADTPPPRADDRTAALGPAATLWRSYELTSNTDLLGFIVKDHQGSLLFQRACDELDSLGKPSPECQTEREKEAARQRAKVDSRVVQTGSTKTEISRHRLEDIFLGDPDAPVTVIEYTSMTCSYCASFHTGTLQKLKEQYIDTGKVKFIMREFPLDNLAGAASMLARCVDKDKFYPFVDMLFEKQSQWARADDPVKELRQVSKLAGFTEDRFNQCVTDQEALEYIQKVRAQGDQKYDIRAVPTIIVNEQKLEGDQPIDALEEVIASALTNATHTFFVQLAARRSSASALEAFADIRELYPDAVRGLTPAITSVDLADKGVWYRLLAGPFSQKRMAYEICGKLSSAGYSGCFVRPKPE